MPSASPVPAAVPLESIICNQELNRRPARQPDPAALNSALLTLVHTMASSPERVVQQLVETALNLCHAQSAGLSLLEEENGRQIFRWHGVAGEYAPHLWGTTPRDFSPCGTVLDRDKLQLMSHLDRHFTYFAEVTPHISEALLVPFHAKGEPIGTIWIISHDQSRQFDAEDARVMTVLGDFAAAAYQTLSELAALKRIIGTIREPIVVLDDTLRIKIASKSFYETFQVTPAVTEGRYLYDIGNRQWDDPELRARLADILPKGHVIENFEVTHDFPSLGPRVMSLNARKISRASNAPELILLAIEDISARKEAEEELLRSHEDSQRFAFVAAHDLRAPLISAVMLLQQLDGRAETKFDHDDRRLLSLAMANLQRLQALMRDILAYSQLGGARNTVITPLRQPLEMALANLQKDLEETGAGVDFDALPTLPVDPAQLTLVFQNLIGNALKFRSREPPRLRIQATLENREHVVSIADNGQGFDPQYAERIFLPFKRLHGPEIPGSGIGLATCKRIVEQLGGRIWAVGERGKGSTFYFTMPAGA